MASYCIGDLHGRTDLFFSLLEKINFNVERDKLYLLGDVIDGNYGGIKIIKYLQANKGSCVLIRGNHEEYFLVMQRAYDKFMLNAKLKEGMEKLIEVYSENLFAQIEKEFLLSIKKKGIDVLNDIKINEWIEKGNIAVRQKLLINMAYFMEIIEYDEEIYKDARRILRKMRGSYDTKEFVKELFEQTEEDYIKIIDYIKNTSRKLELQIYGKNIVLSHSIRCIDEKRIFRSDIMFLHVNTLNYFAYFNI